MNYITFLKVPFNQINSISVLSKRNLLFRYRRTVLGVFWSFLNPLFTTLVLWLIFVGIFAGKFNLQVSYATYILSGILFSNLVQSTLLQIGDSITSTGSIVSKVALSPLSMTYSVALAGFMNFLMGVIPLVILVLIQTRYISWKIIFLIPWSISLMMFLVGFGIWIAIAYSKFYDLTNVIAVLLLLINYVTPIFYPLEILKGKIYTIVAWNPLTVLLDAYRGFTINYSVLPFSRSIFALVAIILNFIISTYMLKKLWPEMIKRI